MKHDNFMLLALEEAKKAASIGEVPVGAIITCNDKVISHGFNKRESSNNSLIHAEIEAIYKACNKLKRWRLTGCSLYVTLEPCPMCAGAIINSRISNLIYGTDDAKSGACRSVINLFELPFNHVPNVVSGVLKEECSNILSNFFQRLRKKQKIIKHIKNISKI